MFSQDSQENEPYERVLTRCVSTLAQTVWHILTVMRHCSHATYPTPAGAAMWMHSPHPPARSQALLLTPARGPLQPFPEALPQQSPAYLLPNAFTV